MYNRCGTAKYVRVVDRSGGEGEEVGGAHMKGGVAVALRGAHRLCSLEHCTLH